MALQSFSFRHSLAQNSVARLRLVRKQGAGRFPFTMEREEVMPKSYPSNLLNKDWKQRKCFWRKPAVDFMAAVHDMEVKDDDVWIVTLPKCGTTWMQELAWLVMHDFDFAYSKKEHLEVRTPFLEFDFLVNKNINTALTAVENLQTPRLIKSHLPLPLLPAQLWQKKPKVIYVYRNPKDALISMYYHSRSFGQDMDKSLEQYLRYQMEKSSLTQMPFDHVAEFYALRDEPWLYYTSFERMKQNLKAVILDVCKFLNKTINETQMQMMLQHLSFEEMKNNPKTNHHWEFEKVQQKLKEQGIPFEHHNFIRKGKANGYKDELSPDFINEMDLWIANNLKKFNLSLEELFVLEK